jgi:PAS domain S-box-containing protein/putative nucleotidyltransferase with HDIG domain
VVVDAAYGVEADYVRNLVVTTDPALETSRGPSGLALTTQQVQVVEDFPHNPLTKPWHDRARQHGVQCSAAVPLVIDGKAVGVLNFYAREAGSFDAEFIALLEEVARNVSVALQGAAAQAAARTAEAQRDAEAERFQRAFLASPMPMVILDRASRRLRAVNKAFETVLGYSLADVPDQATLFARMYSDDAFRAMVSERWESDIAEARKASGFIVTESPELPITCRDGTLRTARGFMTLSGDDIIVQFEDLTATKDAEAALARSARHFRSMIEQNLVGVFVTQKDRIVYANPRLASIVGRNPEDLAGQPWLDLFGNDPAILQRIMESRQRLAAGDPSFEFTTPVYRRDGVVMELGFHTSMGEWDGEPAYVVIAIDVTERRRAEERIAAYVRQLEGTMRDTLLAISRMVELRDPYTAGHEVRVGEIAADIAAEMGWDERTCENLRLVGLVHDIGKIAVPAEILTKPGRLSPIEYQIVQEHAQRGYEILQHVRFPVPIADIIRQHHERMDGTGYPQKLKGEEIRMEARILAVADVVESMASHRPYRPALGLGAAVEEIEKNAGRWYDRAVVEAFLRLVRDKNWTLPV